MPYTKWLKLLDVSTHSRPKAAGENPQADKMTFAVSTHSRPKAAGEAIKAAALRLLVSTHSRPKAAGIMFAVFGKTRAVSTHSRPKAAGPCLFFGTGFAKFQHTAARRRLEIKVGNAKIGRVFQHTAARRRLAFSACLPARASAVSTHSRPKAAGRRIVRSGLPGRGFNTQPPEGGWLPPNAADGENGLFQHTAARRRLGQSANRYSLPLLFQHTAARRRLDIVNS